MNLIIVVGLGLILAGCVGAVNDYATAANAFGEDASANTIKQLSRKHDTELAAYLTAACAQPRAGALMRRFSDEELLEYVHFCRGLR